MSPQVCAELQRLLSALCDGDLDDVQHTRLQELLNGDAECRRLYLEYMDMHAHLVSCLRGAEWRSPGFAVGSAVLGAGVSPAHLPAAETPAPRQWRQTRQVLGYALVASATLAASLLVQVFWRPSGPNGHQSST